MMEESTKCWVAYTTVDSKTKAIEMAHKLVGAKRVACVNVVGPVESVYEWQGQVDQAAEWMLMMKCTRDQCDGLKSAVLELHDYDVPELIMWPISDGHGPYLDWIGRSDEAKA